MAPAADRETGPQKFSKSKVGDKLNISSQTMVVKHSKYATKGETHLMAHL